MKYFTKTAMGDNPYNMGDEKMNALISGEAKKLKKLEDISNDTNESIIGDEMNNLQTGMLVAHQRFGKGKVINIDGAGPNRKATVFFPNIGQKQLLLKFAKLKIIKSE